MEQPVFTVYCAADGQGNREAPLRNAYGGLAFDAFPTVQTHLSPVEETKVLSEAATGLTVDGFNRQHIPYGYSTDLECWSTPTGEWKPEVGSSYAFGTAAGPMAQGSRLPLPYFSCFAPQPENGYCPADAGYQQLRAPALPQQNQASALRHAPPFSARFSFNPSYRTNTYEVCARSGPSSPVPHIYNLPSSSYVRYQDYSGRNIVSNANNIEDSSSSSSSERQFMILGPIHPGEVPCSMSPPQPSTLPVVGSEYAASPSPLSSSSETQMMVSGPVHPGISPSQASSFSSVYTPSPSPANSTSVQGSYLGTRSAPASAIQASKKKVKKGNRSGRKTKKSNIAKDEVLGPPASLAPPAPPTLRYPCPIKGCLSNPFCDASTRTRHVKDKHKKRKFWCTIQNCSTSTTRKDTLRRHIVIIHFDGDEAAFVADQNAVDAFKNVKITEG